MKNVALALAALSVGPSLAAQSVADYVPPAAAGQTFPLSIRSIMRAEANVGLAPTQIAWQDDSRGFYFRWQPGGLEWDAGRSLYWVSADGDDLRRIDDAEAVGLAPVLASGDISPDRRWRATASDGDLYLIERRSGDVRRLTHTEDSEGQPLFTDDGGAVLFRRGSNLFRLELENGALTQLTRIADGPEASEDDPEGHRAFLDAQQLELFEHIRRDSLRAARTDSTQALRDAGEPATVHLARGERVQALTPTRSTAYVLVRATVPATDARRTIVPDWVTDDGYTRDLTVRTKVGDEQGRTRAGILDTATGVTTWIDVAPEGYESEMPVRVFNAAWNDAGTIAVVFAVSYDDKDRWVWAVDAASGSKTLLDHLHDDAWVAGPCFSRCLGFVPGTDRVYFVSEETGYAHLYWSRQTAPTVVR